MKTEQRLGKTVKTRTSRQRKVRVDYERMTDATLLQVIGNKKNALAFETLFKRHKNAMFNLALSITGSQNKAEDAIQEGMLNIWSYATSFHSMGNAKGWIMKIIVRAAMKKQQSEKSILKELSITVEENYGIPCKAVKSVEKREVLLGMQTCIQKLTPTSRRMIGLYFAAEMSQGEIGKLLRLPQRTVSTRIKEALSSLRCEMVAAGFGATIPVKLSSHISSAFEISANYSIQFPEQVLNAITQKPLGLKTKDLYPSAIKIAVILGVLSITICAAVTTLSAEMSNEKKKLTLMTPTPEAMSSVSNSDQLDSTLKPHRHAHFEWNFENGFEGVQKYVGDCTWNHKDKCLDAPLAMLRAPLVIPNHAFVIKFDIHLLNTKKIMGTNVEWFRGHTRLPYHVWRSKKIISTHHTTTTYYIIGNYSIATIDDNIVAISKFESRSEDCYNLFSLKNVKLNKLEAECVELQEVPERYRHPEKCLKTWKNKTVTHEDIPACQLIKI